LFVALGDVMGHGIAAALLMATARGVLRAQARAQGSLGHLLTHLNEHICTDTKGDRFMTMFLAVFDVSKMSMRWVSNLVESKDASSRWPCTAASTSFSSGRIVLGS